jgi:hypothetical protein
MLESDAGKELAIGDSPKSIISLRSSELHALQKLDPLSAV